MQESDNLIPLSPQWLRPGESKSGMDPLLRPFPGYGGRSDISKSSGNGDEIVEADRKRDVFRPTVHDPESGRLDRWRDEERDTGFAIRRDRWREGDKELTDPRKSDRWVDNSSNRGAGEARRPPSERWSDSSNRKTNYDQRRENKWNTRWGPDKKESESWHEKLDVGRDGEVPHDKGLPHGKDEREGDHYRPWRSTASQSRGKGESPQPIATKQTSFGYGRSRGENATPTFSISRGRVGSAGNSMQSISSHSYSSGSGLEKGESWHVDPSSLKYNRTRLLDLFRTTDLRSHKKPLDGFAEIPSLTQEDPLQPLALSAPTPEELVILKGIDKGDILSSGLPQASKDGFVRRNTSDGVESMRNKFDDLPPHSDDHKDERADNSKGDLFSQSPSKEKYVHPHGSDMKFEAVQNPQSHHDSKFIAEALRSDGILRKEADEAGVIREVSAQGGPSANPVTPWRSHSHGEHSHGQLHDWRGLPNEDRSRTDTEWSRSQKDRDSERENSTAVSSYYRDEPNWRSTEGFHSETSRDPIIRRQPSVVLDREQEARKFSPQTSPEDLSLYYKDPQSQIQGPFSGSDLIGWFDAGFFGIDLEVRVAGAPPDTPFSSLGDVMPHLRAKARPPPGFAAPKQSDISESINVPKFSSMGKQHASPSEINILKTDPRSRQGSITDIDNRYLESLMSGNTSSSSLEKFSEGLQGYIGNNSSGMPSMGVDSGRDLNYLLAQKMALERQMSIPSPHSYWPGRDAALMVPNADIVPETPPHAKLLPSVDSSRQIPLPQNMDLMSLLQGVADKSPVVNNGVSAWSNFPVQGVMRQEKTDLHQNQHFPPLSPYGLQQQQRLQPQNLPSSTSMIGQNVDHPSGVATKENMLSSVLSQDPQMLSMLQDQYLLSQLQLHSQASVPQQLSVLDKLLLLKQQQQKQEQQQQLLRQQQQQQLLSQVLSERQSHQHFGDPSYAHIQAAAMAAGSGPLDHLVLRPPHVFLMNSQAPIPNLQGGLTSSSSTWPPQISNDVGLDVSSGVSPLSNLPHHLFEGQIPRNGWDSVLPEHIGHNQNKGVLPVPHGAPSQEATDRSFDDLHVLQKDCLVSSSYDAVVQDHISQDISKGSDTVSTVNSELGLTSACPEGVEPSQVEPRTAKEEKSAEVCEVKKTSEKKSRKQKNSKAQQYADQAKGGVSTASLQQQPKLSEGGNLDLYAGDAVEATLHGESHGKAEDVKSGSSLQRSSLGNEVGTVEGWGGSVSLQNAEAHSVQRAWKPAPGFKSKSLLEIQQEEQWKAQTEIATSEPVSSSVNSNFSSPWGVVVPNLEPKPTRDNYQDAGNEMSENEMFMPDKSSGSLQPQKNKKSQLHDLLAEEVLVKSYERVVEEPPLPVMTNQVDSSVGDSSFIEAKDTKKSRKKSAKGKGTGGKAVSAVVVSFDDHVASSHVEKGKNTRQVHQEKEVLPAPLSGPSLGDFVLWKGEPANPSAAPAWSTEPGKLPKPTSLRDIQKEQEKRGPSVQQHQVQVPTPQKVQSTNNTSGSGASWPVAGTSPSNSTSSIHINSVANAQSKSKADDDLFWGPLDQSKQEAKQSDFPAVNTSNWGSKSSTMKGTQGGVASRQKSTGNTPDDYTLSSSPAAQSSLKERRDAKHSEAMDFRDWCESEAFRLIGSTDTSILEFCLKQSTSEAETLLIENLGSYDPDHKFIDKFLNYKEMLSADVLEIAFQARSDRKSTGTFVGEVKTKSNMGRNGDLGHTDTVGVTLDGFTQGGKKKRKKGKVSGASLLGFNVKSNRIMMGEIQTIDS